MDELISVSGRPYWVVEVIQHQSVVLAGVPFEHLLQASDQTERLRGYL